MCQNRNNWKVGEIVSLPWTSNTLKSSGSTVYYHFFGSRFLCIRDAEGEQNGILVKVLGKTPLEEITMVGGEPFCKDQKDDLFEGRSYSSFRFPTLDGLTEVLQIIRDNPTLKSAFEEAGMHINTESTFWVRESTRNHIFQKKPQFYDATNGTIGPASDSTPRYRITILYFSKDKLIY